MALANIFRKHKLLTLAASGVILVCVIMVFVFFFRKKTVEASPPPPEVEVIEVRQQDVPTYSEWIGTTDGMVNAEIRAQVSGYLLKQDYAEGSFVKKGQLLFEIDERPLQAALDQSKGKLAQAEGQFGQANSQLVQTQAQVGQAQAQVEQAQAQLAQMQAQLAQAEANQRKTQLDVNKYTPLRQQKAVTQQELDNAVEANGAALAQIKAALAQIGAAKAGIQTAQAQVRAATAQTGTSKSVIASAKAAVDAAKADVATAELNLSFTKIVSPIDGIAGIAQAQVGNLINSGNGILTTVSTVDPIKVYYTTSEQEYMAFTKRNPTQSEQRAAARQIELEMVLSDGTTYPHPGRFFVADRQVDGRTGTIRLSGIFPNPGNALRPGQYAKVRAVTSVKANALLVPQRAVTELQGTYQVAVVGDDNKVSIRTVKVGDRLDSQWIIEEGLKPGEKVIAGGVQKVAPGGSVIPKPYIQPASEASK